MRKRNIILSAIKSHLRKKTHKYGIEIPTSIAHAKQIYTRNGNTFWRDAIDLQMHDEMIAFQVLDNGERAPQGWAKVTKHLVLDVKMDFIRKARWVLDGYKILDPTGSTYAGVVLRESVRIAFTYAALNNVDVFLLLM